MIHVAVLDTAKCTSCGMCVSSCPFHAIEEPMNFCCAKCVKYCSTMEVPCEPARIAICAERCDGCGLCIPCCPNQAIQLAQLGSCPAPDNEPGSETILSAAARQPVE